MKTVPVFTSEEGPLVRPFDDLVVSNIGNGKFAVALNGLVVGFLYVQVAEDGETLRDTGDRYVAFTVNEDECQPVCHSQASAFVVGESK